MFEGAELGQTLSKKQFAELEPELRAEMLDVQHELKSANFPVLIIISGVDGAGKGETVNLLNEWFDPRFLQTTAFDAPNDEERARPDYWRFWRRLPPAGRIGIFFGSWYTDPIVQRVHKQIGRGEFVRQLQRVNQTEKHLVDDGAVVVKYWFHLSKEAQHKRLKKLEKNPETRWRVTDQDWEHFKMYERFREISGAAVRTTDTGEAPWLIVEGADARWRSITVVRHLLDRIKAALAARAGVKRPAPVPMECPKSADSARTVLDSLDLSVRLQGNYRQQLRLLQGRLNELSRKARKEGVSSVLVFEGGDAAGKGGAIRRITAALDARDVSVVPIAAPTDEERAHHYLWRFWRHLPGAGRITIFDRSWYGRVLVERVEGFARSEEWQRAYAEINAFEEQLLDHGTVVVKYWLQVSPDEQMRRFKDRENTPHKQFKITEEDYRNREKTSQYNLAVNDMIEHTSTVAAPWTLVASDDKEYARSKVLETFCQALKRAF